MAKQTIIGRDTVRDALMTKAQPNDDELYAHGPLNDPTADDVTYISTLAAAILQANLVDKTAEEIISGLKNFTTMPQTSGVDWAVAADVEELPIGGIIGWSKPIADIPAGWGICDGDGGRPDWRSKFIRGAPDGIDPGATGGANSLNLIADNLPEHLHTGTITGGGTHRHDYYAPSSDTLGFFTIGANVPQITVASAQTGSGGGHSHTLTVGNKGSNAAIDNRPAYYALIFIIRES